jgi:hypothetical protein
MGIYTSIQTIKEEIGFRWGKVKANINFLKKRQKYSSRDIRV